MPHHVTDRARLLPIVAVSLLFAACAGTGATEDATMAELAAPAARAQEAGADETDDQATGIHVSGDWEVAVREPNGALASRREFHNDLVSGGAGMLSRLLGDPGSSVRVVRIAVERGGALCDEADFLPTNWCAFDSDAAVSGQTAVYTTSIVAPADGSFTRVGTPGTVDYAEGGSLSATFTARDLDEAITFVEGQTVEITVTLSFS